MAHFRESKIKEKIDNIKRAESARAEKIKQRMQNKERKSEEKKYESNLKNVYFSI